MQVLQQMKSPVPQPGQAEVILLVESQPENDAKFLACALSNNAGLFITGEGDFEEAYKVINTTVISVSMFYQTLMTGGRQLRSGLEVQRYHQITSTKLDSVIDWSNVISTASHNIALTTIMRSCISGMAVRSRNFKADS